MNAVSNSVVMYKNGGYDASNQLLSWGRRRQRRVRRGAAVHVAVCMSDGITIFVVDNDLAKTAKATYQANMTVRSVQIIEK